jgi:hypothetical protein
VSSIRVSVRNDLTGSPSSLPRAAFKRRPVFGSCGPTHEMKAAADWNLAGQIAPWSGCLMRSILPTHPFACRPSHRWSIYRLPRVLVALRVRLDLSDGQFQQHLCGHDIRRVQRRVSAALFGNEGGTRTLIQQQPRIAGVGIERAYGLRHDCIIVTHSGDEC